MDWKDQRRRERIASRSAEDLLWGLGINEAPVDPLEIAAGEYPDLRTKGHPLGDLFDGQLEYHASRRRFLLFFNTKYDASMPEGKRHPRTRFSVAHELGHFYLRQHRGYLLGGGPSHRSRSDFEHENVVMEREADAFASGLLMPQEMLGPRINRGELSVPLINDLARDFETSRPATARRAVELTHFPCAVMAIRSGRVAWRFFSEPLIDGGCWPAIAREVRSKTALAAWVEFQRTGGTPGSTDALVRDWFEVYEGDHLLDLFVTEEYMPIPSMDTLLVLLTMDEGDLFGTD